RDGGGEAVRVDAALLQRKAVGQHADAGAGQLCQMAAAGAGTRRQHAVLHKKDGNVVLRRGQLRRQIDAEAGIIRIERVARFDQEIFWHQAPPWRGIVANVPPAPHYAEPPCARTPDSNWHRRYVHLWRWLVKIPERSAMASGCLLAGWMSYQTG